MTEEQELGEMADTMAAAMQYTAALKPPTLKGVTYQTSGAVSPATYSSALSVLSQ